MSTIRDQDGEISMEAEQVVVRRLRSDDLQAVVAIDQKVVGRRRSEFFKIKLQQALLESGMDASLAAELDGNVVGFLLIRVFYGEFGTMEPVAVLDTIGIDPRLQGQGIGSALLSQARENLRGLRIGTFRTEVGWDDQRLLSFFHHEGFQPAPRICLDLQL